MTIARDDKDITMKFGNADDTRTINVEGNTGDTFIFGNGDGALTIKGNHNSDDIINFGDGNDTMIIISPGIAQQ